MPSTNCRVGLAIVAILVTATSAPITARASAPIQSYDAYKSWLVACDNTLTCIAKGFGDGAGRAEIKIERKAGPKGSLAVSIRADHRFSLADVRIDGQPAHLSRSDWELASSDDETSATSHDITAVRVLVQRLRNASKVTLGADTEVPLDGFAAAMLRLDERQGRLNTVTALVGPGARSASRVPISPSPPTIAFHPIKAALTRGEEARLVAAVRNGLKAILDKEECDANPPWKPEAYALGETQALVLVPCIMGAYQGSSLAFIAPRKGGRPRQLIAPTPYLGNDPDQSDTRYFTETDFDPKTGRLSMAAKGRGLADCGVSASWIWNGEMFRLSELSLQQACGGVEPGDWPTLFRSVQ